MLFWRPAESAKNLHALPPGPLRVVKEPAWISSTVLFYIYIEKVEPPHIREHFMILGVATNVWDCWKPSKQRTRIHTSSLTLVRDLMVSA